MSSPSFHIHLYGPDRGTNGTPQSTDLKTSPIETSFEDACGRLQSEMPSVLAEPDGSIAWASPDHQLVGMIYDADLAIQYIELRGHCDRGQLRQLVETLSGTDQIDFFRVMILPNRQWKNFQSFERSLPK